MNHAFKRDLVVYKHPNHRRAQQIGSFQLIVTFPRTTKPADGNPVAVLTRKIFGKGEWKLDNKNAIVELDCDLSNTKIDDGKLSKKFNIRKKQNV